MSTAVAVVGAGVVGRMVALQLARQGYAVCLYDSEDASHKAQLSRVAGGLLCPWSEAEHAPLSVVRAGVAALDLWQEWISRCKAGGCPKEQNSLHGSLALALPEDETSLRQLVERVRSKTLSLTAKHGEPCRALSADELRHIEPGLRSWSGSAMLFASEGAICPEVIMDFLYQDMRAFDVRFCFSTPVLAIDQHTLTTTQDQLAYAAIIDARGLAAKSDLVGLRGVRGESLLLRAPGFSVQRPLRLLHDRHPIYLIPRGNDLFYLGATQLESESREAITVQSLLELLDLAVGLDARLRFASIEDTMTGLRPAFFDNTPRLQVQGSLMRINGLYRHGWLLAPVLAKAVVALLAGQEVDDAVRALVHYEDRHAYIL